LNQNNALAKLSSATRALAEAKTLDDVKKIRNIAEAAKTYARAAKLGLEAQNHAAEVKLRAERKAGEMLAILERGEAHRPKLADVGKLTEFNQVLKDIDTSHQDASRWQMIAEMKEEKFEEVIEEAKEKKLELTTALMLKEAHGPHVSHATGENEWYTPPDIIEAARKTMCDIDCDPASSKIANEIVGATEIYTVKENGLIRPWRGRVWLNPPYAQPLVAKFAEAVSTKYESGEISEACILVNNATETFWFQRMLRLASAVCFITGRVKFINTDGEATGAPLQGQVIIYFGKNQKTFHSAFSEKGIILDGSRKNQK